MKKHYNAQKISTLKRFAISATELQNVRNLAICAMLLALRIVLGFFSNALLLVFPDVKIGFNFLPVAIAAILFGPIPAGIIGGVGDIISFIISPMGAYFPGWTINEILIGLVYGFFFYKKDFKIPHIIISEVINLCFIVIPLGSLWMYIQANKAFWPMMLTRSIESLISFPLEVIIIYFVNKKLYDVPFLKKKNRKQKK